MEKENLTSIFNPHFLRQLRAARALLGWTQKELAEHSGVSLSTLNRFERESGAPNLTSLRQIFQSFQKAGVVFAQPEDGSIGVFLAPDAVRRLDHGERGG
jgi:transcriptional regulator with XRE-family HTH domain